MLAPGAVYISLIHFLYVIFTLICDIGPWGHVSKIISSHSHILWSIELIRDVDLWSHIHLFYLVLGIYVYFIKSVILMPAPRIKTLPNCGPYNLYVILASGDVYISFIYFSYVMFTLTCDVGPWDHVHLSYSFFICHVYTHT